MTPCCLPLNLARTDHLDLLLNFDVQDLLVEDQLRVGRLLQALAVKILSRFLHLLQVAHASHIKNLTRIANSSVLISQRAQLVVHVALVSLRARARQPLDAGALFIRVPIRLIFTLHPAVLLVKRVSSLLQWLVPKEDPKDVISVVQVLSNLLHRR